MSSYCMLESLRKCHECHRYLIYGGQPIILVCSYKPKFSKLINALSDFLLAPAFTSSFKDAHIAFTSSLKCYSYD